MKLDAATERRAIAREVTSVSDRAIMKKASDSERILFTIPVDVTAWLRERAKYHGGTLSAEVTMSLRARIERYRPLVPPDPPDLYHPQKVNA